MNVLKTFLDAHNNAAMLMVAILVVVTLDTSWIVMKKLAKVKYQDWTLLIFEY